MAQLIAQKTVVEQAELLPGRLTGKISLFNEDGTPFSPGSGGGYTPPTLVPVSEADAVAAADATPTKAEFDALVALANANKAAINAIVTAFNGG